MPRFLHLFSMAGVAEQMCHYGCGDAVLQLNHLDEFGFAEYYGVTKQFEDVNGLIKEAMAIEDQYDYIIIHDYAEYGVHFTPSKVVIMFHGTKLRHMPPEQRREYESKYPIYVTTVDLLDLIKSKLMPNPVDLELFVNNGYEGDGSTWVTINRSYQRDFIEKDIKQYYPKADYYERNAGNVIRYEDMPEFLEQYDNYVDIKYTYDKPEPKTVKFLSCTGLQAMAVGCKVWNKDGEQTDKLQLAIHSAKHVTENFLNDFTD